MYEYRCKLRKVVDGDTVDIDVDLGFGVWLQDERVRWYGIDTPESRTRDLEEKKYEIEIVDGINFSAAKYFDIRKNSWKLDQLVPSVLQATKLCRELSHKKL